MRPHPYLRAYMAGIVVPTLFLLCATTVYAIHPWVTPPPIATYWRSCSWATTRSCATWSAA